MRLFLLAGCMLLLAMPATRAAAAPPPEVQRAFEEGNRHMAERAYATALQRYETALESGWTSGVLYYNAGRAHYRLGQLGEAVRHFEKARGLLPRNERLRHNLDVVRSRLETPPPAAPPLRVRAQRRLVALVPPLAVFGAGLLTLLGALAWWVRAQSHPSVPLAPRPAVAALMSAGLLVAGLGLILSDPAADGRTVALRGPLSLHEAPTAGADSTAGVPEGTVLRLTERRGEWKRVRSSGGAAGWAPADALGDL